MVVVCERCKREAECRFFGTPSDVDEDAAQNGEWLCDYCVEPREHELDQAIERLRDFIGE